VLPFFATVEACRIGIEGCATGHYWARELRALGHDVRLMEPSYVKRYFKRQKNDILPQASQLSAGRAAEPPTAPRLTASM
jgi:transposase